MSYAHRILTQMRAGCIYRPCDISAMTNIDRDTVSRILKMLARGGLVDEIRGNEYRRKRMYSTRQNDFFHQPMRANP